MEDKMLVKVASWFIVTLMPVFVAIAGWALVQIIDHGNRLTALETEAAKGPRFTLNDFKYTADVIKDHELRIRSLENE